MSEPAELPPGWLASRLGALGRYLNGRGFGKSEWSQSGRPIIRIQNLTGTSNKFNYFDGEVDAVNIARPGDLLMSWAATLDAFIWPGPEGCVNQHIFKIESFIDKRFHFYLLRNALGELYRKTHGSGMVHITRSKFDETPAAVPPLPEQLRIVAKIEELFSDLDAGVAALERVKANLKRYRAAVLKAAVDGRLTEEWRKQHPATEPAAKLLERILTERRAKWEQEQLRKFNEAGKTPPKGWKEKYEEPLPADATDQSTALPNGWCWARCSALLSDLRSGSTAVPTTNATPLPILRSSAVRPGRVDLLDVKYVLSGVSIADDDFLGDGDLLFVRLSGSIDYVAACAIVPALDGRQIVYPDRLFRAKTVEPRTSRFVALCFGSFQVRRRIERIAKSTAGHQRISLGGVADQPLPLPPLTEQAEIVAEVDRRLSVAEAAETQVEHALQRAARLRQAILKLAFEGKLVPQDPTDEPAAALLERVKVAASRPVEGTNARDRTARRTKKATFAAGAPRESRSRR
jgi:type I restriction enzyme S subunit